MAALIDGRTKVVTLPGSLGIKVTVYQVSGGVLRAARQCRRRQMDDPRVADTVHSWDVAELWNQFDVDTLLRAGIVAWTFSAPISAEAIEALDLRVKILIAREIMALSSIA